MKKPPKNISFHFTNPEMVKDLLAITPILGSVLDAGSGDKAWFNNLQGEKYECELERGCDFYKWDKQVDWVIGNPPFHESWKFTEKALEIAQKGIAWLVNNQALNSHFTPRRLQLMADNGFTLKSIKVVADARWFGRYYYLIFTKEPNNFISWNRKTYSISN
jgi:hypothetical protein